MNNELKIEQSLCWRCKHGICIQESERELMLPMMEEDRPQESWRDTSNEINEGPTLIEHNRIRAICFWKPDGIKESPPIIVGNIQKCSRFNE